MARDGGEESFTEGEDSFISGGWENNEDDADTVRNLVQRMDAQEGQLADAALLRPVLPCFARAHESQHHEAYA